MAIRELVAAAAGVLSYAVYFHRGEHDMWAVTYIQLSATSLVGVIVALVKLFSWPVLSAILATCTTFGSFLLGAVVGTFVYRIWLNPLNKFPGPYPARLLAVWLSAHAHNKDLYLKIEGLHKKYGKYVRLGPNDLSISDPNLHDVAYGKNSWPKGPWYVNRHCSRYPDKCLSNQTQVRWQQTIRQHAHHP